MFFLIVRGFMWVCCGFVFRYVRYVSDFFVWCYFSLFIYLGIGY